MIKQELKDFAKVMTLLAKGKGTLSDYMLICVPFIVGVSAGFAIWG